jgi:hypothetical protein
MPVLVQYISATTIAGKAMSGLPIRQSGIAPRRTGQRGVFHRWSSASRLNIQLPRISPRSVRRMPNCSSRKSSRFSRCLQATSPSSRPSRCCASPGSSACYGPRRSFRSHTMADARALVRAEPDLGSRIFADPPPLTDELRPEAADALGAPCWVDADTPADKRWALETIGVLRAWARLIASTVVPLFRRE